MGLVLLLGATGLAASLLGGDSNETTGGVTVRFTEVGVVPPAAPPTSSGANTVRPQPRPRAGQDNLPEGIEDGWIPLVSEVPDQTARAAFVAGYRAGNGPPELEAHFVEVVIPCEWTDPWGTPWYPGNGYVSVGQFHPDTWERAGGGDPNDLSTVGRNVANWLNLGVDPGGTGGWPTCFHK